MTDIPQTEVSTLCPKAIVALQKGQLTNTLEWCNHIPFYRARSCFNLEQVNLSTLPVLLPEDLRQGWDNFRANDVKIVSIYASGGTLGSPKFIAYTKEDWEGAVEVTSRSLITCGITDLDHVAIIQPFGLWSI